MWGGDLSLGGWLGVGAGWHHCLVGGRLVNKNSSNQHFLSTYYMPGTVLRAYLLQLMQSSQNPVREELFTFYRLRELKLSEGKAGTQGRTARSWGSWGLNPGPVDRSHVPAGVVGKGKAMHMLNMCS